MTVSPQELVSHFAAMKTRSTPGPYKITVSMAKAFHDKAIKWLTNIMNGALRLTTPPERQRESSKNPFFPQSYRPISLLSIIGKAFERSIRARLEIETEDLNLIPPEQFGFRRGHSTTDQLLRLTTEVQNNLLKRRDTACVFFDIRKAFDKVWHTGLIYKLLQAKISRPIVLTIH